LGPNPRQRDRIPPSLIASRQICNVELPPNCILVLASCSGYATVWPKKLLVAPIVRTARAEGSFFQNKTKVEKKNTNKDKKQIHLLRKQLFAQSKVPYKRQK
jgi:hypothetical protein